MGEAAFWVGRSLGAGAPPKERLPGKVHLCSGGALGEANSGQKAVPFAALLAYPERFASPSLLPRLWKCEGFSRAVMPGFAL